MGAARSATTSDAPFSHLIQSRLFMHGRSYTEGFGEANTAGALVNSERLTTILGFAAAQVPDYSRSPCRSERPSGYPWLSLLHAWTGIRDA